jgi:hypothetical protein
MILPEPITHRVSQSEARGGLQPGVCEPQWLRDYIFGDTRKQLEEHVKHKMYYLVINSEHSGPGVVFATGDPDVRTSDLGRPFPSLSLSFFLSPISSPPLSLVLFFCGQL